MPTDTERLNWLLSHPGADLDGDRDGAYIRWWHESYWYIVYGNDWRDCIDNALMGKAEKV